MYIESKDDGSGGDNWSYRLCKAPVKSLPPTNQRPLFFTGRMPFLSPNQQCQSTEGKISHSMDLLTPNSSGGLPTLSLTTNSSWLPWGRLPCLSSALWCQYPNVTDELYTLNVDDNVLLRMEIKRNWWKVLAACSVPFNEIAFVLDSLAQRISQLHLIVIKATHVYVMFLAWKYSQASQDRKINFTLEISHQSTT